jgi:hypothetical protein
MTYYIEISYDTRKHNCSELNKLLVNISQQHNCFRSYDDYEINGYDRVVKRNHCINTFLFEEIDMLQIYKFIRKINKLSKVYIESVYTDLYILFASKKYQKMFPNFNKDQIKINTHEENLVSLLKKNH